MRVSAQLSNFGMTLYERKEQRLNQPFESERMKISDIHWGKDSAENDKYLLQYFVTSEAITRLLSKTKDMVVGRKGSGKSALLAKLKQEFSNQLNTSVVTIAPNYNSIRSMLNDRSLTESFGQEVFFQHTWLRQIYLDVLCRFGNEAKGKFASSSAEFAREIAISQNCTSKDFIENITDALAKLKIKAGKLGDFGLTLEKELRISTEVESLEYHLGILTEKQSVVVLLDDLDLGWDNSPTANKMLLGLLAASEAMKHKLKNVHVIIFLREDIYSAIIGQTQHADKYRDVERIRWEKEELIKVLDARINFNRTRAGLEELSDPFASVFPPSTGTALTTNWLIERTLSRPRELIQLVRSYTETVADDQPSADLLKAAEPNYSNWKLADVCAEYTNQYPGLNTITSYWSTEFRRQKYHLRWSEIEEMLLSVLSDVELNQFWFNRLSDTTNVRGLLHILYEVGIFGDFILGGQGGSRTYFSYEDRHEPRFDEVQIHPCFRRALNTVERIRE